MYAYENGYPPAQKSSQAFRHPTYTTRDTTLLRNYNPDEPRLAPQLPKKQGESVEQDASLLMNFFQSCHGDGEDDEASPQNGLPMKRQRTDVVGCETIVQQTKKHRATGGADALDSELRPGGFDRKKNDRLFAPVGESDDAATKVSESGSGSSTSSATPEPAPVSSSSTAAPSSEEGDAVAVAVKD